MSAHGLDAIRPVAILGILNVTPDSFSDGGRYRDADAAIAHGLALVAQGADVVDVGGESTRPGAPRVPDAAERERVVPVIRALAAEGVTVSIDTMNSATARAALEAGAAIVNDVSGGLADPDTARVVADAGVPYLVMHWRGHSTRMDALTAYTDVVADVRTELSARLDALTAAGVDADRIVLDPGLGFAKTREHDWRLLGSLGTLEALGCRVLIGASRKRFLAAMLPPTDAPRAPERQAALDAATAVTSVMAAQAGAWGVRVHDVDSTRRALESCGARPSHDGGGHGSARMGA